MSSRELMRKFCFLLVVLHIVPAVAWLFMMPGGFPVNHPRFLANRVVPSILIGVVLTAIHARKTQKEALLDGIFVSLALGWSAAAVAGLVLFPISARKVFPVALIMGFVLALPTLLAASREHLRTRITFFFTLLGLMMGCILPWTQRAEAPATYPLNPVAETNNLEPAMTAPPAIGMNASVRLSPADGLVTLIQGRHVTSISPLLTFISCSPDRCWTLFAPRRLRESEGRHLTHWSQEPSEVRMRYADLGTSDLKVNTVGKGGVEIESVSDLADPVFSHLNTFSEISLDGFEKLSLTFSPCPDAPIEVVPMDYPAGRPARFAYMDSTGRFHVVEAASGEKGPFKELASGCLGRGDPLVITILDSGKAVASVELTDWTSQVSTDLSPTAGWHVPQNAIEFALHRDGARASANIFVTLASTSVGRGFDSVGHAAGTYRNRMKVQLQSPAAEN